MSIGFHRSREKRNHELTNNKNIKGKNPVRTYLKAIFGFAKHHEKSTHGFGYKLVLTRNNDNAVLNKHNATNNANINLNSIDWYVPHCTPSVSQQTILSEQLSNKTPTELRYVERSVFMKQEKTKYLWTFELGTQEGTNVPIGMMVGFQQRDR